MPTVLALQNLYTTVTADLVNAGVPVASSFGWRAVAQQTTAKLRMVWVPGDPSGNLGENGAARHPGGIPRPLALLREQFTVYLSAADNAAPEDELQQYKLVRLLRDAWLRALHRMAHGTVRVRTEAWMTERTERRHGATLMIVAEVDAPVPDELAEELTALDLSDAVDATAEAAAAGQQLLAELATDVENE